jgi:hypothetical protein
MAHRVVGSTTAAQSGSRIFGVVRFALAVAVVSAVGLLVGVATGAIPGSEGKISACYGKLGGVVRVIDLERGEKCSTVLEKPLTWNVAGPPGRDGSQGPPGPQGERGVPGADAGPPMAFRSPLGYSVNILPGSGDDMDLTSLTLPPGDYLIWGRAILGVGQDDAVVNCRLAPVSALRSDEDFARVRADPQFRTQRSLSVTGSATLTTPTEIFLRCFAQPFGEDSPFPFEVHVEGANMHAVEVDL